VYDANGNTLADPSAEQYTWEFENRLKSVTVTGTGITTFKYIPSGEESTSNPPTFTSIFVYDADNLLEKLNAQGSQVAKLYADTEDR
jgi:hypothetical protein